jgi:hypothetical protein
MSNNFNNNNGTGSNRSNSFRYGSGSRSYNGSNLFKKSQIPSSSLFILKNSDFPEINDLTLNSSKNNEINNYILAFQKEEIMDDSNKLPPGCISYTQEKNNEIVINYGDMKGKIVDVDSLENNNQKENYYIFNIMIESWEKYKINYINLYGEDVYNSLYVAKQILENEYEEDYYEYEYKNNDDNDSDMEY